MVNTTHKNGLLIQSILELKIDFSTQLPCRYSPSIHPRVENMQTPHRTTALVAWAAFIFWFMIRLGADDVVYRMGFKTEE